MGLAAITTIHRIYVAKVRNYGRLTTLFCYQLLGLLSLSQPTAHLYPLFLVEPIKHHAFALVLKQFL